MKIIFLNRANEMKFAAVLTLKSSNRHKFKVANQIFLINDFKKNTERYNMFLNFLRIGFLKLSNKICCS